MSNPEIIITLATRNEGKRQELIHWLEEERLPLRLELNESVGEIEETGASFLENALIKAQATPPVVPDGWVLAEDSGLVVDTLAGQYGLHPFPGLYSNRWLTLERRDELLGRSYPNRMALDRITENGVTNSDLCQGILALMREQTDRAARYCCGMILWRPSTGQKLEALASTELWVIQNEPRGLNGFGYDPVMCPIDEAGNISSRTVAELSRTEKNRISHRGKAFHQIINELREISPAIGQRS